jgi:O-antigen/teichoic acid export membrane protein
MTYFVRAIFLGTSSIAILIKQFLLAQNLSAELFGLYSTVFLMVALFQQLGGFGTQVYYSASLIKLDYEAKHEEKNLLSLAFIPFLFTLPLLYIISHFYFTSLFLVLSGCAIAFLNCFFVILTTRYYILDNQKYCKIIALKGILSLSPMLVSFVTQNLNIIIILDLLTMTLLVGMYFTKLKLFLVTWKEFKEYFYNLCLRYTPAIILSASYTYLVKIYVSMSFTKEVIGIFFFIQILIMIAQNIQYILSVLLGPLIKRYRSRLNSEIGIYISSYSACIIAISIIFASLYFALSIMLHRLPEYTEAAPLLLPTIFVSVIRGSDLLSIVNMLMDRPMFVSIQQGISIVTLILLISYLDVLHSDKIEVVANLLWLEFYSLFIGQIISFCILIIYLRLKN